MRIQRQLTAGLCVIVLVAVSSHAVPKQNGLSGKWATQAVKTAKKADMKCYAEATQLLQLVEVVGRPSGKPKSGKPKPPCFLGNSPDGVAITMTLKVNKSRLTGGEVVDFLTDRRQRIEAAAIDEKNLEFRSYQEVGRVKIFVQYTGALVDENTLTLTRSNSNGRPRDTRADGSAESLVFHRFK